MNDIIKFIRKVLNTVIPNPKVPIELDSNQLYTHKGVLMSISQDGVFLFSLKDANPVDGNPVILTFSAYDNLVHMEQAGPHLQEGFPTEEPPYFEEPTLADKVRVLKGSNQMQFLRTLETKQLKLLLKDFQETQEYEICSDIQAIITERN